MYLIFEDHQYQASVVKDVLDGISELQDIEKNVSVSYVGYYYNPTVHDCVFILPKVMMTDLAITGTDGKTKKIEVIAGVETDMKPDGTTYVTPEDIITPEGQETFLTNEYRKFIYEFAVWVYRALCVYRKANPTSRAIYYKQLPQEGGGARHQANTYLDIILSMIRFNRENQNYFMFVMKNLHLGNNKINWTRTIAKSQAIIQDNAPIYLNPVNKKRQINFDEELFIIFFSILHYINETYGFNAPINCNYTLITKGMFTQYLKGMGRKRLRQIKYKYFSDKALQLWDLCFAFFDFTHKLSINTTQKEYLLARNFNVVFEAMIDDLIGEHEIPRGLKVQDDGKRVDHMYRDETLLYHKDSNEKDEVYYIGDSKYYKVGHRLEAKSIYKQYTYARNVIQWNINLWLNRDPSLDEEERQDRNDDKSNSSFNKIRLRQDGEYSTEGYNVIPNFFISAYVDDHLKYDDGKNNIRNRAAVGDDGQVIMKEDGKEKHLTYISYQFPNRLFDRDTLILSHYDVNFLYVLWLYARNKASEKSWWKEKVRKIFRDEVRNVLEENFEFYAMTNRYDSAVSQTYIDYHFKNVLGKVYQPFSSVDGREYYSLALRRPKDSNQLLTDEEKKLNDDLIRENEDTLNNLRDFFICIPFSLNENMIEKLEPAVKQQTTGRSLGRRFNELSTKMKGNCILTALIRKNDDLYEDFLQHSAKKCVLEKLPNLNHFADINYLMPMVAGKSDGIYKVNGKRVVVKDVKVKKTVGMSFDSDYIEKRACLELTLGEYIPVREGWLDVYQNMKPREFLSMEYVGNLLNPSTKTS